jgi:hypothetical protein
MSKKPERNPAPRDGSKEKSSHAPFCAGFLRKTDSAVWLGVPLPGLWNRNAENSAHGKADPFRMSLLGAARGGSGIKD